MNWHTKDEILHKRTPPHTCLLLISIPAMLEQLTCCAFELDELGRLEGHVGGHQEGDHNHVHKDNLRQYDGNGWA